MLVYSKFSTDGQADSGAATLVKRYSSDGGKTWTEKDELVVENEGGMNVMSVSLIRLASGELLLFYGRKNSMLDCRPYMRVSKDEGKTWSKPRLARSVSCVRPGALNGWAVGTGSAFPSRSLPCFAQIASA